MTSFNINTAKERFPALNQPQVFFDNAGGSQTLGTVIDSYVHELASTDSPIDRSAALSAISQKPMFNSVRLMP